VSSKNSYLFHPFKIRTLQDQRFLIVWTLVSFLASILGVTLVASRVILSDVGKYLPSDFLSGGGGIASNIPPEPARIPPWDPEVFGTDKLTFILLGYDAVDEFAHRSDTLMVGAVDFYARKVRILSIPRDTLADIPRHGFNRINAAYALGHEDLTRQTVEAFVGVDIDYVVSVNYEGFVEIVDALGGVDMTVEKPMNYDDRRGNVHIHFEPGEYHFDGEQALEYARYRHDATGDFGRIDRQQGLIRALFDQAVRPSNWGKLTSVPQTLLEHVTVVANPESPRRPPQIELRHLMSLVGFLTRLGDDDIVFRQVPTVELKWNGLSVLRPVYGETAQVLWEVFKDDDPIAWRVEGITGSGMPEPGAE